MMLGTLREAVREVAKAVAIAALSELAIEVTLDLYARASGRRKRAEPFPIKDEGAGSIDSFEPRRGHGHQ
jgi:hypothetical protein